MSSSLYVTGADALRAINSFLSREQVPIRSAPPSMATASAVLCQHPRCERARGDSSARPFARSASFVYAAAAATQDADNEFVAAVPFDARASLAAFAEWLAQLRRLVADHTAVTPPVQQRVAVNAAGSCVSEKAVGSFVIAENAHESCASGNVIGPCVVSNECAAAPLGRDLADIVCSYVDPLSADAPPVWVVAPRPFLAVAALPPRLTLGQALAVFVDAYHDHRCRHTETAVAVRSSPLADVTLETVEDWEYAMCAHARPRMERKPPPRATLAALAQRPLGLFSKQPVRLRFDSRGLWTPSKHVVRDVLTVAACALSGVSLHECPPRAAYIGARGVQLVGVLPPRKGELPGSTTSVCVLESAASIGFPGEDIKPRGFHDTARVRAPTLSLGGAWKDGGSDSPAVYPLATDLIWTDLRDYAARVANRPSHCPLTDAPLSRSAVDALARGAQTLARQRRFTVFEPCAGVFRPSHWLELFETEKLELHGSWRGFCDTLPQAESEALERLAAAVAFAPDTTPWFLTASPRPQRPLSGATVVSRC